MIRTEIPLEMLRNASERRRLRRNAHLMELVMAFIGAVIISAVIHWMVK